jgi:uncharacterized protein involved in tolerance to divalent cations
VVKTAMSPPDVVLPHGVRRHGDGFQFRAVRGCRPVVDLRPLTLAIGVVSTPKLAERRSWLRRAAARFAEPLVAQRFIVGCPLDESLSREAAEHGDLLGVAVRDATSAACVEKSFAWWSSAVALFPNAAFLAKTDDDSLNHLSNLVELLVPHRTPVLPPTPSSRASTPLLVYGGWAQFSS